MTNIAETIAIRNTRARLWPNARRVAALVYAVRPKGDKLQLILLGGDDAHPGQGVYREQTLSRVSN